MAWKMRGTYFETCSCEFLCPCTVNLTHPATYERCRVALVFNIVEGEIEGTDVAGRKVALIADTPKVMTEGNWRVGALIDDGAFDEQTDQLSRVFSGRLGGPMVALAPLVGELVGAERAPVKIHEEGLRHGVTIGDAVDLEIEDVVPFGVETGRPARLVGVFHPAGSDFAVAEATRSRIDAFGIEFVGKAALSASELTWAA